VTFSWVFTTRPGALRQRDSRVHRRASSSPGRDCKVCSGTGMWKSLAAPQILSRSPVSGRTAKLTSFSLTQPANNWKGCSILSLHPKLLPKRPSWFFQIIRSPDCWPKRCERASALCCQAIYHQTNSSPPSKAASAGLIVMHPVEVDACFRRHSRHRVDFAELAEPLTPRESEVLQMLASGLANKQIAAKLAISEHTVKFHVASILGKLGAGAAPKLSLSAFVAASFFYDRRGMLFLMKYLNWKSGGPSFSRRHAVSPSLCAVESEAAADSMRHTHATLLRPDHHPHRISVRELRSSRVEACCLTFNGDREGDQRASARN